MENTNEKKCQTITNAVKNTVNCAESKSNLNETVDSEEVVFKKVTDFSKEKGYQK